MMDDHSSAIPMATTHSWSRQESGHSSHCGCLLMEGSYCGVAPNVSRGGVKGKMESPGMSV